MAIFAQKVPGVSEAATRGPAKRAETIVGRSDDALELEAERAAGLALLGHGSLGGTGLTRAGVASADRSVGLDAEGATRAAETSGEPLAQEARSFFEPRLGHDFSRVRIHADAKSSDAARGVRARAYTLGNDIVFGRGEYRPGTPGGRRLLGHELAHVAQQSRMGKRTIQRFDSGEHKALGDVAAEGRMVSLAPGLMVTYGDLVALGGDYFGDWQTLETLARIEGITEGTRGEVLYALLTRVRTSGDGTKEETAEAAWMGKLFDEKAKAAVNRRYKDLALHNIAHFPNPKKGDAGRTQAEKDAGPDAIGAGATYRQAHGQALTVAAAIGNTKAGSRLAKAKPVGIGNKKDGLDGALMIEAFADHFLTDAFSSGHQQTERASIQDYWNAKYPQLWTNLQGWLADYVTLELRQNPQSTKTKIGKNFAQKFETEQFAMPEVEKAFAKIPAVGFGDIVAGAIHGYFNEHGAQAEVDGKPIELVGDKHLLSKAKLVGDKVTEGRHVTDKNSQDTFKAATAAVKAGIAEVYRAYELGRQGEDPERVPEMILKEGKGTLAAEKLMPQLTPDAKVSKPEQKSPNWEVGSLEDLIKDPRLLEGLSLSLNDYADTVESSLSGLSKENMEAVEKVLIEPMRGGPHKVAELLRHVLEWKPIRGGGFDPELLNDLNEMRGQPGGRL